MIPSALALALLLAVGPAAAVTPAAHYLPHAGDGFQYTEAVVVDNGTGNYTGYTEATYVNGSIGVTAVPGNGTDTASYSNTNHYGNDQGVSYTYVSSGSFTFSASTFRYVAGTDNQTGDNGTEVWFYMDNALTNGGGLSLLGTPMSVASTNETYALGWLSTPYVSTIYAVGSGVYQRDDVYGVFVADFTWQAFFDPATGFIVGYLYTEHDLDRTGDGFTWTDLLKITSSTYPLSPAALRPAGIPTPSSTSVHRTDPVVVVGTIPSGGVPTYSWKWLVSVDGAASAPATLCAANSGAGANPGARVNCSIPANTLTAGDAYAFQLEVTDSSTGSGGPATSVSPLSAAVAVAASSSSAPGLTPVELAAIVGLVLLVIVLVTIAVLLRARRRRPLPRHSPTGAVGFVPPPGIPPPPISLVPGGQPTVQQIVLKETVKVNCRYCGALIDTTDTNCPSCGAPRT